MILSPKVPTRISHSQHYCRHSAISDTRRAAGLMSFRSPKARYRRRNLPPSPSTSSPAPSDSLYHGPDGHDLILVSDIPPLKRPRNSKTLFLPSPEQLITLPGGIALTQPLIVKLTSRRDLKAKRRNSTPASEVDSSQSDPGDVDVVSTGFDELNSELKTPTRRQTQGKKVRQQSRWTTHVIPALLPIHLCILRETESLRLGPKPVLFSCACSSTRPINVTCIYFQRKFFGFHICVLGFC